MTTVDASLARNNFFKILDKVFFEDEAFVIKKAGVPMAQIIKLEKGNGHDIMKFAGIWKKMDSQKLTDYVYQARKDKAKTKRKLATIK